ncbi:MAG: glycoside hydrolase family 88 protein [Chitinivibrionales bacterium]|nr:glycoside hydrolase family 88 protein [Chitinivibrionales bacterium]
MSGYSYSYTISIVTMNNEILLRLLAYIQNNDYKGWDPYDGLNSPVIRKTPLYKSALFRLCWIQLFKRSPINLRPLFFIPKERNPKGIALCVSGLINLFKATKEHRYCAEAEQLLRWLSTNYSQGYHGHAWGYNFPWQSRYDLKEKYFPTIVTTSFAAFSFLDGYEATGKQVYLDIAKSSAEFILHDLNIHEERDALCFSYGPDDTSRVYNATALGSQLLARLYNHTKDTRFLDFAKKSLQFVVNRQNSDGSWWYGDAPKQKWIDGFHTGYNMIALKKYQQYTADSEFSVPLEKAFTFYLDNLYTDTGEPKYYHNKMYPIDIHTCAVSILTLLEFNQVDKVAKIAAWTNEKLYNAQGYFNYQLTHRYKNSIPYMRWTQAWMFYALSSYLNKRHSEVENDEKQPLHKPVSV